MIVNLFSCMFMPHHYNQEFAKNILFSSYINQNFVTIKQEFENVKKVIQLLSRSEPITGLFQFTILDKNEKKSLVRIYQKCIL